MSATATITAGGGVGGLFIPLVVGGALVGRTVGEVVNPSDPTLYVILGMAAFLGAGYRVPLAAVVFVAETTGQPGFIVPALFAAVAAELVMGEQSITRISGGPNEENDRARRLDQSDGCCGDVGVAGNDRRCVRRAGRRGGAG